ncbi:MAG: hypothetical protein IT361_11355 [Gemmatimonadaceae bacterium]|nr:hypothetical protein [Gemmatimonadaceae bacterium]
MSVSIMRPGKPLDVAGQRARNRFRLLASHLDELDKPRLPLDQRGDVRVPPRPSMLIRIP